MTAKKPCASWRTLRFVEGYAYEEAWCTRTEGPCPYPNTPQSTSDKLRAMSCAYEKEASP